MSNEPNPKLPQAIGWLGLFGPAGDRQEVYTAAQMHAFRAEGVAELERERDKYESMWRASVEDWKEEQARVAELVAASAALETQVNALRKYAERLREFEQRVEELTIPWLDVSSATAGMTLERAARTVEVRSTMADWTTEYLTLIEDCEKRSDRLDDWSLSFVDSLSKQLAAGRRPTPKQIEKLDDIWERATARG